MSWIWFHRLGSPPHFYRLAGKLLPWISIPALLLSMAGLIAGLALAPPDYQQGNGFRILYVHAAAAWLSLMIYSVMAISAAVGLVWRISVAYAMAANCAAIGVSFAAAALASGMLWGRPTWGTYWEWDSQLTSELVLLFLYLGYLGLRHSFGDYGRADRASAMLAILGAVNMPMIYFAVSRWNSLHHASSLMILTRPMGASMYVPMLLILAGFTLFFLSLLLVRARAEILRRERDTAWIGRILRQAT